jgi:hypothetical protein
MIGLPAIALAAPYVSRSLAVAAMIGLICMHQMLEYLGTVALWTWWSDLVPRQVRGRYFARRQQVQLAVTVPTLLGGGYLADGLRSLYRDDPERLLWAYALPTGLGALALLASLWPLARMPATRIYRRTAAAIVWRALAVPLCDRRYWPLLAFRGWFSLANGISQTVQSVVFPKEVLGLGVGPLASMRVLMQVGQFAASGPVGRYSDRYGNRPMLVVAQSCVSVSLVFYLLASPRWPWLVAGAWILFSAYVAHNICLPNLVLKLASPAETSTYVAVSDTLGGMCHALATIGGGVLFDWLRSSSANASAEPYRSCLIVLAIGLAMRGLAVPLAMVIQEPGAWTWREIIGLQRGKSAVSK